MARTRSCKRWGDAGPTILCIHGMTSSRRGWARFAKRLFLANRVYAYDQRGHGDAAASLGPMTLEQGVRDLARVTDAIPGEDRFDRGPFVGRTIALLGGLKILPRRVVAVYLLLRVPPGTFFAEYVDDMLAYFPGRRAPIASARCWKPTPGSIKWTWTAKCTPWPTWRSMRLSGWAPTTGSTRGSGTSARRLPVIPIPALMAIAGVDSVVNAEDLAFLRRRGGPNVTVAVFENHGHSLHRSAFDQFTRLVESF